MKKQTNKQIKRQTEKLQAAGEKTQSAKGKPQLAEEKPQAIRETDLYAPVRDFLADRGYSVRSEVKDCDVAAVKGEELVVVELKRNLSVELLAQAVKRQKSADSVYIAVPRPQRGIRLPKWREILYLLKRLELGLMIVDMRKKTPALEVVQDPVPFDMEKSKRANKRVRTGLLKEVQGRTKDLNLGGSSRRQLMTAYREKALHIACCLDRLGPMKAAQLRKFGTPDDTHSILYNNFYGWFEKVDKGLYRLRPEAAGCLEQYCELAEHYRNELEAHYVNELEEHYGKRLENITGTSLANQREKKD